MITIDNVQYRNLEEQVKKNMDDIKYILEEEGVLNEFGIKVVGQITSSSQLPDPDTYEGEYGDAYAVGTTTPYTFYIYTRANGGVAEPYWFNIGQFPVPGKDGAQGPQGPAGPQGVRGSTWQNGTSAPTTSGNLANDKYLNTTNGDVYNYTGTAWQLVGNIRGPQGIQGPQGTVGPAGQQGIQGPKGEKGDPGPAFVIAGTVPNEGQLPDPSTLADNIAYLVGSDNDYDLYVQLQDTGTWQNVGKVEGVAGPQGPTGPQGPRGPQGIQGIQGPAGTNGTNGANGRGIQSIINGTPVISGNQTQTPITVSYSDNTTSNFTVYAERGQQGPQGIQGVPGVAGKDGAIGPTGPAGPAGEVDYSLVYTKEEVDSGFIKSSGETSRTGTLPINVKVSATPALEITTDSSNETCYLGVDNISFYQGGKSLSMRGTGEIFYRPVRPDESYTIQLPKKDGTIAVTEDVTSQLSTKQDTLVSGTNIKTINGNSLLGSGDLTISGGGSGSGVPTISVALNSSGSTEISTSDYNIVSADGVTAIIDTNADPTGSSDIYYKSSEDSNSIFFTCSDAQSLSGLDLITRVLQLSKSSPYRILRHNYYAHKTYYCNFDNTSIQAGFYIVLDGLSSIIPYTISELYHCFGTNPTYIPISGTYADSTGLRPIQYLYYDGGSSGSIYYLDSSNTLQSVDVLSERITCTLLPNN